MHLSNYPVFLIDYIDKILHLPILGPDHILQLANSLITNPYFFIYLSHLSPEIVKDLSLIIEDTSFLCDLPVTEIHIRLNPCYFLLSANYRLIAAGDISDIMKETIEESDLLVNCKLVILHLLLDLCLHLCDVFPVDPDDACLRDLRLDPLLDLGQLHRLAVFVEQLRHEPIGEVLQHSLVGLQMLVFNGLAHESYLSLPSCKNLFKIRLQQARSTLLVLD